MVNAMKAAARLGGCINCRTSVLRTFAAIAGVPLPVSLHNVPQSRLLFTQRRTLVGSVLRRDQSDGKLADVESQKAVEEEIEDGEFIATQEADPGTSSEVELTASNPSSIPWYLQVNTPTRTPKPLSERQRIPDLPPSPPDILQPLLQQISVDLGLDDLTILDLRDLDPPPALGANLLMVLGTARSEKHLHVSADRLCRWLRSNYKLRPEADGLLGRNEIKLRMKRKARRAKLVGKNDEDMDDGIRTGWVCVNVGTVDGPSLAKPVNEKFIGFGRRTDGVKLVVQILVEEKRQEIDLEKLWTGVSKKQEQGLLEGTETEQPTGIAEIEPGNYRALDSKPSGPTASMQTRGFHTSARHSMSANSTATMASDSTFAKQSTKQFSLQELQQMAFDAMGRDEYSGARMIFVDNKQRIEELRGEGWRLYMLHSLKRSLENMPTTAAIEALGRDHKDRFSTPFITSSYQTIVASPGVAGWEYQVWLHCFARQIKHPGYAADGLMLLVDKMQLSAAPIQTQIWLMVIRSLLQNIDQRQVSKSSEAKAFSATKRNSDASQQNLEYVVKILQHMQSRGEDVMSEDVFLAIQEAIATFPDDSFSLEKLIAEEGTTDALCHLPARRKTALQERLNALLYYTDFPIKSDETRMQLLELYAQQYDWESFWTLWRSIARQGEPRSAALYACMFYLVAKVGSQKACISVLRTWISDMDREDPPVYLEGDVRKGVEACLKVIDPQIESHLEHDKEAFGEWIGLWSRCQDAEH